VVVGVGVVPQRLPLLHFADEQTGVHAWDTCRQRLYTPTVAHSIREKLCVRTDSLRSMVLPSRLLLRLLLDVNARSLALPNGTTAKRPKPRRRCSFRPRQHVAAEAFLSPSCSKLIFLHLDLNNSPFAVFLTSS
jgi:hypothetical protein